MPAAREEQITVVEGLIGLHFADDHRRLLLSRDGWETDYDGTAIEFLGIDQIREAYVRGLRDGPPELVDFVLFASHGKDDLIGYDRRSDPPPVVLLDRSATDWSTARLQGVVFGGFIDRLLSGKALDFSTTYADPPD